MTVTEIFAGKRRSPRYGLGATYPLPAPRSRLLARSSGLAAGIAGMDPGADSELIQYATKIKVRAERRCGEMTSLMETARGRRTSSDDAKKSKAEQLADHGLSVQEAHRYEALAAMPAEHFEIAPRNADD